MNRNEEKGKVGSYDLATTFPRKLNIQDSEDSSANTAARVGTRKNTALTLNTMGSALSEDEVDEGVVEEKEPLKPDKSNFVFGMHPLNPDQIVINPKYPPQFFPYLYPHLYPHLFPKLYPHYTQNYEKLVKDKKKADKQKKDKDKRTITVVLPDGRHLLMNKKEFLAYQLALSQQGYAVGPGDLQKLGKDGAPESEDYGNDLDSDEMIAPMKDAAVDVDPGKLQASSVGAGLVSKGVGNSARLSQQPSLRSGAAGGVGVGPGGSRAGGQTPKMPGEPANMNIDVPS